MSYRYRSSSRSPSRRGGPTAVGGYSPPQAGPPMSSRYRRSPPPRSRSPVDRYSNNRQYSNGDQYRYTVGMEDRHERDRRRARSRSRSYERYGGSKNNGHGNGYNYRDEDELCRLHVADLNERITEQDLQRAFSRFGELKEVWMARNPPSFAFVVYRDARDAAVALREMDARTIGSCRIRVTQAKPRTRGRNRWDPEMRCYQCGEKGHFARNCHLDPSNSYSKAPRESNQRRYERSYSIERQSRQPRAQSPGRTSYPKHSRSRSPRRDYSNSNYY